MPDFAGGGANDHDGDFLFKRNPGLQDGTFLSEFLPDFRRIFGAIDLELAFAIVSEGGCLQDARRTEFGHGGGQIRQGFDDPEAGAGDAVLAEEILFLLPVLANADSGGGGEEADLFRDPAHGGKGDVFKLDSGDGGFSAEIQKGLRVVERLVDDLVRDLNCGSLKAARPDNGAHAHAAGGECEHASKLATADDADDLLLVQREKYGG